MSLTPPIQKTWPDFVTARVGQLRKRLLKQTDGTLDAILITNPVDIRYLTGFNGEDSFALIPMRGKKLYLITDFRFIEQMKNESPQMVMVLREGAISTCVGDLASHLDLKQLAIQPGSMTVQLRKAIAKKTRGRKLVEIDDGLLAQRAIKDAAELKLIRKAIDIQQKAYLETLDFAKPGMTENEVTAYLEYRMRSLGADGPSFPSIVAVNANAALPHAHPGSRKLKANGMLLIDWGAFYQGYASDMTRVVAFGKMPKKIAEIYQIVLDAQLAAIATIKPGVPLKDVDAAARDWITKAGYGELFGHGTGHGIGLEIHEQPTLSRRSEGVCEVGQVVTVEPGIYIPGVGGVRIEDDVLVTQRGHQVLSKLPKSLESAII